MSDVKNKFSLTEGSILGKLLLVALPIIGSQIIQMTYNLTDMFWLGRVGSVAVAASGTVGMYMWLSMAFAMYGRMGAEIGVSQNMGRGDVRVAKHYSQAALWLSIVLGLAFALVLFVFKTPLIGFFNIAEPEVIAAAESYMSIVAIGLPFSFVSNSITGTFTGSGNSRLPFYINCIGLGINMVLDPIFILTMNMGVTGAAVATVIAQVIAAILSVLALLFSKQRPFERFRLVYVPEFKVFAQIFKWATPIAVESFLFCFLSMIVSRMVAGFGEKAMAAQRIGSQVESLSWLIGGGFSSALTAYIGQNFGAGKWERIHKGFRASSIAMCAWGVIVTVILFFGASLIYELFMPGDAQVAEIGVVYLQILALCQIFANLEGAASGAFRGLGKTMPPSIVSITTNALRVVLAFILMETPLGINGIWIAIVLGASARGLWMYIWYLLSRRTLPTKDVAAN